MTNNSHTLSAENVPEFQLEQQNFELENSTKSIKPTKKKSNPKNRAKISSRKAVSKNSTQNAVKKTKKATVTPISKKLIARKKSKMSKTAPKTAPKVTPKKSATKAVKKSPSKGNPYRIEHIEIEGLNLRYLIREGTDKSTPLFLINGIGANLELCIPFVETLHEKEVIIFDIPGTGGSEDPLKVRRFKGIARLANKFLDAMGYGRVDVAGVSWGGALAQQFAHQYPERTRRLILAATTAGMVMVPAKFKVLYNMVTPKRYISKNFMRKVAGKIYGGRVRRNPKLIEELSATIIPPRARGYVYQLLAGLGWTSFHWLHTVEQPTLILAGDDDPLVRPVNAKIMSLLIPNCRLEIIPGGGHLFLLHNSKAVTPTIREFLNKPDVNLDELEIEQEKEEWPELL